MTNGPAVGRSQENGLVSNEGVDGLGKTDDGKEAENAMEGGTERGVIRRGTEWSGKRKSMGRSVGNAFGTEMTEWSRMKKTERAIETEGPRDRSRMTEDGGR